MSEIADSMHRNIEQYLDHYSELPYPPHFAVLLKGAWGSGKTWFINQYRKKLENRNKGSLYISLYGVSSLNDIQYIIFQQLHPKLASPGMAIAGEVMKMLLKGSLYIDNNHDDKNDGAWNPAVMGFPLPEYFSNADDKILFFDDLERSQMKIEEIFGYINYFVEHKGLKAIIIANEDEIIKIDGNSNSNYLKFKEKLIGQTLEITPNFEQSIHNFIGEINKVPQTQDQTLIRFLEESIPAIENTFFDGDCKNLRILKQTLFDFSRIFKVLPQNAQRKTDFCNELLTVLIAFSIEIKVGNIIPDDINIYSIAQNLNTSNIQTFGEETLNDYHIDRNKKIQTSIEKYKKITLYNPLFGVDWWANFFKFSYIDKQVLSQKVKISKYFSDEKSCEWLNLYFFDDLSNESYNDLIGRIIKQWESRYFQKIGEIKHLLGIFIRLSNNELFDITEEELEKDAYMYIEYIFQDKTLIKYLLEEAENLLVTKSFNFDQYGSYGFQSKDTKIFQEISSCIENKLKALEIELMNTYAKDIENIMREKEIMKIYYLICLQNDSFDPDSYCERFNYPYHEKYIKTPVLKYIDKKYFVDFILSIKSSDRQALFEALDKRYEPIQSHPIREAVKFLLDESEWLESIRDLLDRNYNLQKRTIISYRAKESRDRLGLIISKLKK